MGQALDASGNVLGEAFGQTKSEVFEKLDAEFAKAAEIRVRSLDPAVSPGPTPPPDRMLQFFVTDHLPPHLAAVSGSFCQLAHEIVATVPSNPERTVALRKLLEAKDCAVRALL